MRTYSTEEIRHCFSTSSDFNEIFDVFQSALAQKITDLEPYRLLFWNPSLTPDEVRLFGEKLAGGFPETAYDVYLWLGEVFEATYSSSDNHELAVHYFQKAASARPSAPEPYCRACDCYEPDLSIPPLAGLIEFAEAGSLLVADPAPLFLRLAELYRHAGNQSRSEFYRRKADEGSAERPEGESPIA